MLEKLIVSDQNGFATRFHAQFEKARLRKSNRLFEAQSALVKPKLEIDDKIDWAKYLQHYCSIL